MVQLGTFLLISLIIYTLYYIVICGRSLYVSHLRRELFRIVLTDNINPFYLYPLDVSNYILVLRATIIVKSLEVTRVGGIEWRSRDVAIASWSFNILTQLCRGVGLASHRPNVVRAPCWRSYPENF